MTVIFKAPLFLPLILGAAFVVVVLAALLKKGGWAKKIVSIGLAFLVCGGVLLWQYHDTRLVVSDQGIQADTYGKVSIPWTEVTNAAVIADLGSSPYAPKFRTNGTSLGSYRTGWFRLQNGDSAFLTLEIPSEALLIQTTKASYLFGPNDFAAFVEAVAAHVAVKR